MKRLVMVLTLVGVLLQGQVAHAGWTSLCYGGYQPWWNIFAHRNKCMSPEEERLQRFWHDYYDALKHYYGALDHIDWVAYYKNHGYQINNGCGPCGGGGGCCGRINYAPVFVTPAMQWAVPNGCLNGPPVGPNCCPPGGGMPMGGMPVGMPMAAPY